MNIVEVSEQTVNATTVSTGAGLTVSRFSSNLNQEQFEANSLYADVTFKPGLC